MGLLRAKVKNGRLILDRPLSLPDGTMLDLILDDEGDDLTPRDRALLNASIARAWTSAKAGKLRPGAGLIGKLRTRT